MTREELVQKLDECIEKKEKQWGKDSFYAKLERERKQKVLDAFDNNLDPVPVAEVGWRYEDGFDIRSVLYTDGSVREEIYRM